MGVPRVSLSLLICLVPLHALAAARPLDVLPETVIPATRIDRLAVSRHPETKADICSDAVFLRRAYLDVTGTLPTAGDARAFLADRSATKRRELIESLLARDEFADYQANRWCDVLRVKAEFPVNLWPNAAQAYRRSIWTAVRDNKPFDRFARDLLTASGSNFRVGESNFYRAVPSRDPQGIARAVAQTFLGARADRWPADRLSGMSAFFARVAYKSTAEWKEEIVFDDPSKATAPDVPSHGTFPDGTSVALSLAGPDPRERFADWLVSPDNRWFARAAANRVWAWLLGRGIVHEPDDFRDDNPPANPELLDYLADQLVASHFDLKQVYRLILNSRTYQRPAAPAESPDPAAFTSYPLRRLDAEVLIDAICQITGTSERYSSPIPEPFTFLPAGTRAIDLPDASVTSPFLDLFGRPPRDTGLMSERNDRPSPDQRLHLLNSTHVQRKLEQGPAIQSLLRAKRPPAETISELYLTILSRYPTDDELRACLVYAQSPSARAGFRDAAVDVAWALVNSTEFLYRH